MILLAVDPSLNRPGFAVLEIENGEASVLTTTIVDNHKRPKKGEEPKSTPEKLLEIGTMLYMLLKQYEPDLIVRERAVSNHYATASLLYRVVGALDIVAYKNGARIFEEIYPTHVKEVMTGNGGADKETVASALPYYVGERKYLTDDESDAVAIGLTYAIENGLMESKLVYKIRKKLGRPKKNAPRQRVLPHENAKNKRYVAPKPKRTTLSWRKR